MWVMLFTGNGMLMCLYSMEWYARRSCPVITVIEILMSFSSSVHILTYLSPPTPSPIPQTTLSFTLFSIMHLQLYPPLLLQLFSLIPTTVLTPTALFILSLSLTLLQFSTFSSRWGEVIGFMFQSLFLDNAS